MTFIDRKQRPLLLLKKTPTAAVETKGWHCWEGSGRKNVGILAVTRAPVGVLFVELVRPLPRRRSCVQRVQGGLGRELEERVLWRPGSRLLSLFPSGRRSETERIRKRGTLGTERRRAKVTWCFGGSMELWLEKLNYDIAKACEWRVNFLAVFLLIFALHSSLVAIHSSAWVTLLGWSRLLLSLQSNLLEWNLRLKLVVCELHGEIQHHERLLYWPFWGRGAESAPTPRGRNSAKPRWRCTFSYWNFVEAAAPPDPLPITPCAQIVIREVCTQDRITNVEIKSDKMGEIQICSAAPITVFMWMLENPTTKKEQREKAGTCPNVSFPTHGMHRGFVCREPPENFQPISLNEAR